MFYCRCFQTILLGVRTLEPLSNIQKADPLARKKAIWILFFGLAFGTTIILGYKYFENRIHAWVEANIDLLTSNPEIPFVISLVLVSPLFLFSGYLFFYGYRAARAQRFPAPGFTVIRDTVVHCGTNALVRGRIVQALSLVLAFASAMIPVFFWYVFRHLAGGA